MYRKIENYIENYLKSDEQKVLCIKGARQIGKSYIIRKKCKEYFKNYIEINFDSDKRNNKTYQDVRSPEEFYVQMSMSFGNLMGNREDTVVFIDEIQEYPQFRSLLKQLREDNRFRYIVSGSLLGVELNKEGLTPMGSVIEKQMFPMDFEEFLIANGVGEEAISYMRACYEKRKSLTEGMHKTIMDYFLAYLYVGGLPDAVQTYVNEKNVMKIKDIQKDIYSYYCEDATKYDDKNRLKIKKIYEMLPSNLENKVKRIQYSKIENKKGDRAENYSGEFEYLLNSGIAIDCKAISEPKFPLIQSSSKSMIKLYMNDVGLLTYLLYRNNVNAILQQRTGVNLGAVYETVVAQELYAHGYKNYYYDRKKIGEVDFLVDDFEKLNVLPIEVKSGKESFSFKAMTKLLAVEGYRMDQGIILSNDANVYEKDHILHLPIYDVMFI